MYKIVFKYVVIFFALLVASVECNNKENIQSKSANNYDLWELVDPENMDETIPVINQFLHDLPVNLSEEQRFLELEKWLKLQNVFLHDPISCVSCIKTDPPTTEVKIRFVYGGRGFFFVMDIQMTQPMTVTGFHDIFYVHKDEIESVNVPFTEYSLNETSCRWGNLDVGQSTFPYTSKLIIINSNEELEKYVNCAIGNNYPAIDYSQNTLLLSYGVIGHWTQVDSIFLQQYSTEYVLNVNLLAGIASVITEWQSAIVVGKLAKESIIGLKINMVTP